MTTVRVYWSNICILHRMEKQMLEEATKLLASKGIDLQVRHFGIGYPQRMAQYLSDPDAEIPDLIVSTDLEVFEDRTIYDRFRQQLHPLAGRYPVRKELLNSSICQWPELLPFLVIPLVFCTSGDVPVPAEGLSFEQVIKEQGVAFGGIDNSGAKAVLKALWDRFGRQSACDFARRSSIQPMPINAFQQVRSGVARLGIVPTVYAKSADGVTLKRHWPREGAIALPSYIAAHRRLPLEVMDQVLEVLLDPRICRTYQQDGDLCCALESAPGHSWADENSCRFLYPSPQWFERVSPAEFEAEYTGAIHCDSAV